MTVRLNLCDGFGDIKADDRIWIMNALEDVRDRAASRLSLADADVNIIVSPGWVIPEFAIGGFTFNRSVAQIAIDPWSPRFREPQRSARLGSILSHELHHIARFRNPASGWSTRRMSRATLGHALIAEGLAQAFEEEMGFPRPFTAMAVSQDRLRDLGEKARLDFDAPEFDYDAWFFGRRDDSGYPRFGGYALGYALARAWMTLKQSTPSQELGLEPAAVLAAWRTGQIDI